MSAGRGGTGRQSKSTNGPNKNHKNKWTWELSGIEKPKFVRSALCAREFEKNKLPPRIVVDSSKLTFTKAYTTISIKNIACVYIRV